MQQNDTHYYGQGKIYASRRDPVTKVLGPEFWIGDVSDCTLKLTTQQVKHRESNTGQNSLTDSFTIARDGSLDMTLHSIQSDNLALVLYGNKVTVAEGTVTDEPIAVLTVGQDVRLANPGVSDLVITDSSSPTPKELVAGTHYDGGSLVFGRITPLSITGLTPPYKADYSFGARNEVGIFSALQPEIAFRYEGVNLADGNAAVITDIYRLATQPLAELPLITSGTDVAGLKVSADMLADKSQPATGPLGQYGKVVQLGANS